VPHIVAKDERGLGYGIGYAYAQDNLCLLANEVLTVNGERSRYFGAKGKTLEQRDNLASDLFFTWLNTRRQSMRSCRRSRRRCVRCWRAMPAVTTAPWPSAAAKACPPNVAMASGCGRSPARTWSN
jgi:acyl-homoserine lactone acylase PvdQ